MSRHHSLDIKPVPESVLYINEPGMADLTAAEIFRKKEIDTKPDNVRVYIPLDINHDAIIRRLQDVYVRYGDPTESNEIGFLQELDRIIAQVEIYDQVRRIRDGEFQDNHSSKATKLVKEILEILWENEGCGEIFPYRTIDELKAEYKL